MKETKMPEIGNSQSSNQDLAQIKFAPKVNGKGGGNKTQPRPWVQDELNWAISQRENGLSVTEIAEALDRSEVSVSVKLKRVTKTEDTYNKNNRELKYQTNKLFANEIQPNEVLDLYAGQSWWEANGYKTLTNDIDTKFKTKYSEDALNLLCGLYLHRQKFDLVDLDPYGSAYDLFDLAIKISKKAVIVSFGEWGHKRWKRYDFVAPRYGITTVEEFGQGEKFIAEFQRIARCNKRYADPKIVIQYENFLRVYFKLDEIKITEQWKENNNATN
jgi:hypothetical protein